MHTYMKRHFLQSDLLIGLLVFLMLGLFVAIVVEPGSTTVRFVTSGYMVAHAGVIFLMQRVASAAERKTESLPCFDLLRESETYALVGRTFGEMRLAITGVIPIFMVCFWLTFLALDASIVVFLNYIGVVIARVARSIWIVLRVNEIERAAQRSGL